MTDSSSNANSSWYNRLKKEADHGAKANYTVSEHSDLYDYVLHHSLRETPIQKELRDKIASEPQAGASGTADEAQFIQLIMEMIQAKNIIEVGVFKGYTTLAMALKLPKDGKIIGLDVAEYWSPLPEQYWKKAGVDHLIEMRFGPATTTMQDLINDKLEGTFDLVFIDANKNDYINYYELSLKLLRSGGLVLIDNVLFHGTVTQDPTKMDDYTKTIHQLNELILRDDRVTMSMIPIADGLSLCRKK